MAKKQFPQGHHQSISPKRILGTLVSLVVFFLLLTSVIGLGQKYFALKSRSTELNQEQNQLSQKEQTLSDTNSYLATPEGTEESLRERYNYIKPGEQMIVITPDQSTPPPPEKTGIVHWWDELLQGLGLRKDDTQ
jgi:cell division protein FtsB